MTTVRGGRGGAGGASGNGPRGGGNAANSRRGSWRGGPPGSNGSFSTPRGGSPAMGHPNAPRTSINDHMNLMGKVTDDKARSASAKGFKTDTDISASSPVTQRELQPWTPDTGNAPVANGNHTSARNGGPKDAETFGLEDPNTPWDQFETNARLFGATTDYKEEIYTTKLDRSGANFKQREKEATRLAAEIMGQTSTNSHIAEERNQVVESGGKDEESKYSGVQRNPNAYVPPAARRTAAGQGPAAPRASATAPAAASLFVGKSNGSSAPAAKPAASQVMAPEVSAAPVEPVPPKGTSEHAPPVEQTAETVKNGTPSPRPDAPAQATAPLSAGDDKNQPPPSVVDQFRHFVGTERAKVEATKQNIIKQDRERVLTEFKKFQTTFKVPMPIPTDMLNLLSKDEEKQKAIAAKAAQAVEDAKRKPETVAKSAPPAASRKISMKIPEIPPFKPKVTPPAPTIAVPESATKDIPLATSPTPSTTSIASAAKLNPKASTFVFKPNPTAAAFTPGQSSTVTSPATRPPSLSPAAPAAGPGPSSQKNPFFREPPQMAKVNQRDDFNPWKHGQPVPAASSIQPQWPYTGRRYNSTFMAGPPMHPLAMAGSDDDPNSPHFVPPHMMQGIPPNYPPYALRFQSGMPLQGIPGQMGSGMFSPGHQFAHLPGGSMQSPSHMGGPPPNGMPMHFYQNGGMPQNAQFIPQHLHFNPNAPQRPPIPGGPSGPGQPMYFQHQPTPQQTPQMHSAALQPPPAPQPYQSSPIQAHQSQLSVASFDNGGPPGGNH